jgi:hypothetical protein
MVSCASLVLNMTGLLYTVLYLLVLVRNISRTEATCRVRTSVSRLAGSHYMGNCVSASCSMLPNGSVMMYKSTEFSLRSHRYQCRHVLNEGTRVNTGRAAKGWSLRVMYAGRGSRPSWPLAILIMEL